MEGLEKSIQYLVFLVGICFALLLLHSPVAKGEVTPTDANVPEMATTDSKMESSDTAIVRRIRDRLVRQDRLSPAAKNVVIRSREGRVVLEGNVETPSEKTVVGNIAGTVVGIAKVTNNTNILQ